jgi:hypothetical protein
MHARWLLPKTRVSHEASRTTATEPGKTETIQTPRWDDFCFAEGGVPPIKDIQDDERPRTSSGVSGRDRSKSKTRPQFGLTLARPKTSEGRPPSTQDPGYSPSKLDGGMIGVAFGSPTHPPTTFFGTLNDLAPPSTYEESVFEQAEPMYQIKGRTSKWKKLGSLFKGGKAAADKDDMFEVPFYKVRIEDESPEPEVQPPAQRCGDVNNESARSSPTPPPKDVPRRSIDERLAQARLEVARLEEAVAEAERKAAEQVKESPGDASRPKLDLVIPDIKMDRYSVMFADLKEIPPHSKLLARRSKKLDHLKPISMEDMKQIDEMVTPDTSTLSPRCALPRRATSPSVTKTTAGFSLFPAATLTPNYMTRQALAIPSPQPQLKRSVTSPARLSPRAETFAGDKSKPLQPPQADSQTAVISPGDTTASSDREAPWSAQAFLSPTSTITTIDEDMLLEMSPAKEKSRIKPSEPALEARFPDSNEAQHMQFLASPTLPEDTGPTSEASTPVMTIDPSQDDYYKITRVASSVFDQAIAEIEAFGVPSLQDQPPLPSPPSAYVPFLLAPDETKSATQTIEKPPPVTSKSRLMMMNMPSPITEAPEESPAPSPAKPRPKSEITALPQIPEPKRAAPPAPTKFERPPTKKHNTTPSDRSGSAGLPSPIPEESEEIPRTSPETSKAQPKPAPQETKRDVQASPSKGRPRSNSRQRTTDKAAKVLGEILPAPQHKMAIIAGRSTDAPKSPADEAPPVPTKDSKFVLPLSRYAVKGTAAEVTQKSGLKASAKLPPPAKPIRSVTEPLTTMHMNTSYPKSKPSRLARSASDESLQKEITNPVAKGTATSNLEKLGMERPSVMTVMAVVKPAPVASGGEVGVARTVSLSRKPSQRILVKRTDSPRDTSPEAKEARAQKLQQKNEQAQQMSLRAPRSTSRPKGPMANLKRSESFKRAIEVGMDDDDEGDMRSGELRARAMSPEMREVTTGLVVNGHKVMKSSVGVIEDA